jgi:hypothetical protein
MVSDDWEGEVAAAEVEEGGENFDSRAGTLYDVGDVITLERGTWGTRGGEYLNRGGGGGGTTHTVTEPLGRLNAESIDSSSSLLEYACSVPYDEIGEEGREGEKERWRRSIVGLCICVPKCDSIPSISSVSSAVIARGREVGGEVVLSCVGDLGSDVESPRAVVVWVGVVSRGGVVIVVIGIEAEGEVVVEVVMGKVDEGAGEVLLVAGGVDLCVGDCRHLVGGSDRAGSSGKDGVEVVLVMTGIGEDGGWGETVGDEVNKEKNESNGVVAVTTGKAVAVLGGGEEEWGDIEIGTGMEEEEGRTDTVSVSDVCDVVYGTEKAEEEGEELEGEEDMTGRDEGAGIGEGEEGVSWAMNNDKNDCRGDTGVSTGVRVTVVVSVGVCGVCAVEVTGVCGVVGLFDLLTGLLMLGTDTTSDEESGGVEVHSSTCNSLVIIGGGMFCMVCEEHCLTFVGEGEECSMNFDGEGEECSLSWGGEIDVVG